MITLLVAGPVLLALAVAGFIISAVVTLPIALYRLHRRCQALSDQHQ